MQDDRDAGAECLQKLRAGGLPITVTACRKCGGYGGGFTCTEQSPEERARRQALLVRARARVALERELREMDKGPWPEFSSIEELSAAVNAAGERLKKQGRPS